MESLKQEHSEDTVVAPETTKQDLSSLEITSEGILENKINEGVAKSEELTGNIEKTLSNLPEEKRAKIIGKLEEAIKSKDEAYKNIEYYTKGPGSRTSEGNIPWVNAYVNKLRARYYESKVNKLNQKLN